MADTNQDELDRVLDAALAKYAAAEPRPGLEDRLLANLRAERKRLPDRAPWHWCVAAALAAVIVAAISLAWKSGKPSHPLVAIHPPTTTQATQEPTTQVVSSHENSGVRPSSPNSGRTIAAHRSQPAVPAWALPKLDQFPSPQPPSQQELAVRRYVSDFPQEATLIAQAQEQYEKETRQQMKDAGSETDSDQQER
jgi:hypothetical protein